MPIIYIINPTIPAITITPTIPTIILGRYYHFLVKANFRILLSIYYKIKELIFQLIPILFYYFLDIDLLEEVLKSEVYKR